MNDRNLTPREKARIEKEYRREVKSANKQPLCTKALEAKKTKAELLHEFFITINRRFVSSAEFLQAPQTSPAGLQNDQILYPALQDQSKHHSNSAQAFCKNSQQSVASFYLVRFRGTHLGSWTGLCPALQLSE